MPTPFLINASALQVGQPLLRHWQGPFQSGSDLYVAIANIHQGMTDTTFLSVFKSSDNGHTWAEQDAANAPQISLANTINAPASSAYFKPGDTVIHCAYLNLAQNISLKDFDIGSGTWGTAITTGPSVVVPSGVTPQLLLVRLSSGDSVITFMSDTPVIQVYLTTYSGSWSTPLLISTESASGGVFLQQILVDGLDGVHILHQPFGNNQGLYHSRWDAGTVVGPQLIYSEVGSGGEPTRVTYGMYNATRDEVAFPFGKAHSGSGNVVDASILRGTPANNPTFSIDDTPIVYDPITDQTFKFPVWGMTTGDRQVIFAPGNGFTLHQILVTEKILGVWTTPSVFWDLDVDPPSPPPGVDQVEFSSATIFADGSFGLTTGLFTPVTAEFCDVQYYISTPVSTATLTTLKVVSGGTATFTDWAIDAAGPDPQSGAGGFGPVAVTPGDYALTESGPSGYTTSGFVCSGGTQHGNTVTIAPGDTVICVIRNIKLGRSQPEYHHRRNMGAG